MKKRINLLAMIIAIVSSVGYAATLQRTILSHNGKLTQYDASHWLDAITDAVVGDTVYFTSGSFGDANVNANLVIDKAITLIGAGVAESDAFFHEGEFNAIYGGCGTSGESTILETNITIAIPGSVMLKSSLMEGFIVPSRYGFEPSVCITEPVTGLVIKRCQIGNSISATAKVTNFVLEGCSVGWLYTSNMENADIHNSIIWNLESGTEETEFTNCQLSGISGTANNSYINCVMESLPDYNTFVNCLYWDNTTYPIHAGLTNCWVVDMWTRLSKTQLQSGNYLGTDGTVIGPLGGPAPFTLISSQPYVSSSTLTYSKATKKLNVNVTVKQGK